MSNAIEVIPAIETQTAITRLAQDLQENFVYDGEKWSIDEANPPTIEDSYLLTEKILQFKNTASNISDQSSWLIGNIMVTCRGYFGDDFDITTIGDITDSSYNTLITSESVYLFFGDRKIDGLSFTHHKEVFYTADISDEQKFLTLKLARDCELSAKKTRKLASYVKNEGPDILHADITPIEVINILDAYKKDTEAKYICITFDNVIKQSKESLLTDDACSHFRFILKTSPELEIVKDVQNVDV